MHKEPSNQSKNYTLIGSVQVIKTKR